MWKLQNALLCVLLVTWAGCGEDAQTRGPGEPPDLPWPEVQCDEVNEGLNTIDVNGTERRFWIASPATSHDEPLSAVFWFHGFSGSRSPEVDAQNDAALLDTLGVHPDADPDFPFVRVLLEDLNLQPFNGLDWDIRTHDPNHDLELFDIVVGCLRTHRNVGTDRIFAAGFSAGATIVNLLHATRSDHVRAIYTASGLWINEPENLAAAQRVTILPGLVAWDWPPLDPIDAHKGAILLTHGGSSDNVPGTPATVNLSDAGRTAAQWLVEHDRVVVECVHDQGHTLHPEVSAELVLDFFASHIGTGPSPWAGGRRGLPESCVVHTP